MEQQAKAVTQMRFDCQKEVINLRDQLFKREKLGNEFKEIDVRYFDVSEGLTEDMQQILNGKLRQVKEGYTKVLKTMSDSNN